MDDERRLGIQIGEIDTTTSAIIAEIGWAHRLKHLRTPFRDFISESDRRKVPNVCSAKGCGNLSQFVSRSTSDFFDVKGVCMSCLNRLQPIQLLGKEEAPADFWKETK